VQVPGEGLFLAAYKTRDNGNGTWRYDFGVYNISSHRSGGSFSVPIGSGVTVSNIGFNDVNYHSGEPYDNTNWVVEQTGGMLTWRSPQTYDQNQNSNALRWGTMYNFWFDSNRPPQNGSITLGLFRPGTPTEVQFGGPVPQPIPNNCPGDVAPKGGDGAVNVSDLLAIISTWGPCGSPCPTDIAPQGGDGAVNVSDLLAVISTWGDCPK
jgi:hypothetical protein